MGKSWLAYLCSIFAAIAVFAVSTSFVSATRGCCSWHGGVSYCDSSVGTLVCNDGTYSPSCGCQINIQPTSTPTPIQLQIYGNANATLNKKTNTYSVSADWDDVDGSKGFSVGLSQIAGADPGPAVDTYASHWTFQNVKSGKWYVNVKSKQTGIWSNIVYWSVTVPKVAGNIKGAKVTAKPTTILWKPTNTPMIPTNMHVPVQSQYSCNCAKTCTQMTSCAEAYYQLNTCGCTVRDGDHDGVPCESICQ